jgi:hypothetical protein
MRISKRSGLLITESARDFGRIHKELHDEIQPKGAIERMHVDDIAWLTFDIQRLRRSRAELWNTALLAALENLLKQLLLQENFETHLKREYAAKHFARHYFDDEQVRAEVAALLRGVQLTEASIEAEAFRLRAEDLERIDRMLALARSVASPSSGTRWPSCSTRPAIESSSTITIEQLSTTRRRGSWRGSNAAVEMASERQIAANRQNAGKSTGPRSAAGKRRSSRNAHCRGLSKAMSRADFTHAVEVLAREIAGDAADRLPLDLARDAAEAELELDRVRRFKVAFIGRVSAFGRLDPGKIFASRRDEVAWVLHEQADVWGRVCASR